MDKASSYKQIAKATGIFGGVQVVNLLISFIRSKYVAVLLGTTGIGILGMLTATISIIATITNLGINFSAVRTISEASSANDPTLISHSIITLRRWIYFTGLLGVVITLVLAHQLSFWSFGDEQYTWAFICLSSSLLFQALNSGQLALLQGLRKIRQLAKANIIGSLLGLFLSLPLYYWLGLKGIVPALIVTTVANLISSYFFTKQVKVGKVTQTLYKSFHGGMDMVRLGSAMMVSGIIVTGVMYLIRIYISNIGGLEQVGLYSAAWAILNGYVGMIFTAMATDYFPRLSAVHRDNSELKRLGNEQAEIIILMLGPLLIIFTSALPTIIEFLFTYKFLSIIPLIQWASLGIFFKAASWSIAFIIVAKGDGKIFLISEIIGNSVVLVTNIAFYHFFQLQGIGIAFLINYIIYLMIVLMIVNLKYNFKFTHSFIKLFAVQFTLNLAALFNFLKVQSPHVYFSASLLFVISSLYTYYEVKKRINLSAILFRSRR